MRAALVIILCVSRVAAEAQSNSSATVTAHIGKGYELVQNDRFAEAAGEFRAALAPYLDDRVGTPMAIASVVRGLFGG